MIEEYIARYGRRLYGLCLSLCANRVDAEDLYQDTWLRAMDHLGQYDGARDFEPWLTRICVNLYRNMLRKRARSPIRKFASSQEMEAVFATIASPSQRDYTGLYYAIDQLPEKWKVTVILFYFEDMDLESTARVMGVPVGTVKSRLNRARKRLKEVLTVETDLQF